MDVEGVKSGYLKEDFKLFHIKDKKEIEFEYHYHDFNKVVIFLSGEVTYVIEGKSYYLKPKDILLVPSHHIHKPIINPEVPYERVVIWIGDSLIKKYSSECDLSECFRLTIESGYHLMRLEAGYQKTVMDVLSSIESSLYSEDYGEKLLMNIKLVEFLIYLNRIYHNNEFIREDGALKYDELIENVIRYVNDNLAEDLGIQELADKYFVSKSYLMHKFRDETGFTLHNYIVQKRLLHAMELIKIGEPVMKASVKSGFNDYSTFQRAFKKAFKLSPRDILI